MAGRHLDDQSGRNERDLARLHDQVLARSEVETG
jgi:hypothetical protein